MPKAPSTTKNGQPKSDSLLTRRVNNLSVLLSKIEPVPPEWIRPKDSAGNFVLAKLISLADVRPLTIEYLWDGRIAIGKFSLIVGVPGLGKSLITTYLAARTSTGGPWVGGRQKRCSPGGVVLMSCEDDLADTIHPRLVAAEADLKRIQFLVSAAFKVPGKEDEEQSIDLKRHLPAIEDAILKTPGCRLLILDPISGYLTGIDSHKDGEVRPILARLGELAAKHHVAIVAVAHMNKSDTQAAVHRASGSTAFVAAARSVLGVVPDPEDAAGRRRLLLPIKNNLGNDQTGLAYTIEKCSPNDAAPIVRWEPDPVRARIDDVMNRVQRRGPEPTERNEAATWLKAALSDGPRLASEIFAEAEEANIAKKTLKRAKAKLGVSVAAGTVYRDSKNHRHCWWKLPGPQGA